MNKFGMTLFNSFGMVDAFCITDHFPMSISDFEHVIFTGAFEIADRCVYSV